MVLITVVVMLGCGVDQCGELNSSTGAINNSLIHIMFGINGFLCKI